MTTRMAILGLLIAAAGSAFMMWIGAGDRSFATTAWSAAAFLAVVLLGGILSNLALRNASRAGDSADMQLMALRHNGRLCAIVYAWGAAAMAAMYKLTDLYWQHGLQYACAMLLFAAVIFAWTYLARHGGPMATPPWPARAVRLNLVHGVAATIAVVVFLASGKLWANKPDWAANIVFTAGGLSIVALCSMAALTLRSLRRTG